MNSRVVFINKYGTKADNSLLQFKDIEVNRKLNQSIQELCFKFKLMENGD